MSDPAKQFLHLFEHLEKIRQYSIFKISPICIYVERNLGFEAEHHQRALGHLPNVSFYIDQKADRVGVLTTEDIKHAMCQLVNVMLEEHRIHMWKPLISTDPDKIRRVLRDQLETYSYQVKLAQNTFQKDRIALSGKVGGCKDDLCICFQLACYFTQLETQRARDSLGGSK